MASNRIIDAKLKLVKKLFKPIILDNNNELIDNGFYKTNNTTYISTYNMIRFYLAGDYKITQSDLKNINIKINRLINILSLDENKITREYIATKLSIFDIKNTYKKTYRASDDWIKTYKKLIKYIKKNE